MVSNIFGPRREKGSEFQQIVHICIMNIIFAKYYYDDEITEYKMDRTCSTHGTEEE